jgi:hypothetical protein
MSSPAMPDGSSRKKINLALQGGGAYGAFTWGVLDHMLEDGRIEIEGITGASAGAVNAIMLADGFARGGSEEARRRLADFWRATSLHGNLPDAQRKAVDRLFWFLPFEGLAIGYLVQGGVALSVALRFQSGPLEEAFRPNPGRLVPIPIESRREDQPVGRRQAQRLDIADYDHEAGQFLAALGNAIFGRLLHRVDGIGAGTR